MSPSPPEHRKWRRASGDPMSPVPGKFMDHLLSWKVNSFVVTIYSATRLGRKGREGGVERLSFRAKLLRREDISIARVCKQKDTCCSAQPPPHSHPHPQTQGRCCKARVYLPLLQFRIPVFFCCSACTAEEELACQLANISGSRQIEFRCHLPRCCLGKAPLCPGSGRKLLLLLETSVQLLSQPEGESRPTWLFVPGVNS